MDRFGIRINPLEKESINVNQLWIMNWWNGVEICMNQSMGWMNLINESINEWFKGGFPEREKPKQ